MSMLAFPGPFDYLAGLIFFGFILIVPLAVISFIVSSLSGNKSQDDVKTIFDLKDNDEQLGE